MTQSRHEGSRLGRPSLLCLLEGLLTKESTSQEGEWHKVVSSHHKDPPCSQLTALLVTACCASYWIWIHWTLRHSISERHPGGQLLQALLLETLSVFPGGEKGASVLCSQGPLDVARAVLVEWPPGGPRFSCSVTGNSIRFSGVVSEGFLDLSLVEKTPGGATSFIPHYWKLSSFFCGTVFEAGYQ